MQTSLLHFPLCCAILWCNFSEILQAKMSIVSSVAMQKSKTHTQVTFIISYFCWQAQRIHLTNLNPLHNFCVEILPDQKIPDHMRYVPVKMTGNVKIHNKC